MGGLYCLGSSEFPGDSLQGLADPAQRNVEKSTSVNKEKRTDPNPWRCESQSEGKQSVNTNGQFQRRKKVELEPVGSKFVLQISGATNVKLRRANKIPPRKKQAFHYRSGIAKRNARPYQSDQRYPSDPRAPIRIEYVLGRHIKAGRPES